MNSNSMRQTLRVTKALSDMQRLRILAMLDRGELCVCQIVTVLGLAPSTVSKHLSLLSEADLVVSRKDGRWAYYSLPKGDAAVFVSPVMAWLKKALLNDAIVGDDVKKLDEVNGKLQQAEVTVRKGTVSVCSV